MEKTIFKHFYIYAWWLFLSSLGLVIGLDIVMFDFFDTYRNPNIFPNSILGPILVLFQIWSCYYLYRAAKLFPFKHKNKKVDIVIQFLFFWINIFIAFILYAIVGLLYACSMGIDCM